MEKRLFIVATLLVLAFPMLYAQLKVVKKSSKTQPEWISGKGEGFAVAMGTKEEMNNAKLIAFDSIKKSFVQIAINIIHTQNNYFKSNGIETNKTEEIVINSNFYKNITIDKTDGFYWEKLKDQKSKIEYYNYYLKYSWNAEQMNKTILDLATDYELTASLEKLHKNIEQVKTVEDMNNVWNELMFLNSRFTDTDVRKAECEKLLAEVEANFNNIEVKEMINIPGKLTVTQLLNNKALITSKAPKITSNCATVTEITNFEEQWAIEYDYSNCNKASSGNILNVEFENKYNNPSKKISFDASKERLEIKVSSTDIVINKDRMATIYIASMYRGNLILDRIVLRYNDLNFTDITLEQILDGAGMYTIRFSLPPDIFKIKINDRIRGEVYYKSEKTGQEEVFRFFNQKVSVK